ncbi:hypothetical protein [Tateyamaria sp. SN3-11]|uniref:hypothetical protein n=1 Tax=Tateyamaria sp. SN3-11 TaxID=3092147 RepID=UPI0039EA51BA
MNTTGTRSTSGKSFLTVIDGTGHHRNCTPQPHQQMSWSLDVLYDLKLAAERQGFDDVANEIEVAYQRVKFILTRHTG